MWNDCADQYRERLTYNLRGTRNGASESHADAHSHFGGGYDEVGFCNDHDRSRG
jgi:hypothetical protein